MIRIFTAPYFTATKLKAFKKRGEDDGRLNYDFEDIAYLLNNRTTIRNEMNESNKNLKAYFKEEFKKLWNNHYLDEWMSANLEYQEQNRARYIMGNIQEFAGSI